MKSVASEASLTLYLLSSRSVQFLLSAELLLIQDRGDSLQLQIFTLFRHIHMMRFFAEWLLFVDEAIFRWSVFAENLWLYSARDGLSVRI